MTCATVRTATRIEGPVLDIRCKAGLPWVRDGPRRPASEMYVRAGSRLFSNSGIGCQALRDVPAGFTVFSAVGARPSAVWRRGRWRTLNATQLNVCSGSQLPVHWACQLCPNPPTFDILQFQVLREYQNAAVRQRIAAQGRSNKFLLWPSGMDQIDQEHSR